MYSLREFQAVGSDLYTAGLNNSHSGNMSVRDNRCMQITKSGAMLHRLEFDDIIETLIGQEDNNTHKASREKPVHSKIYADTDYQAIVHAHPPAIIALSLIMDHIMPIDSEGAYFFNNGVSVLSFDSTIASDEVAKALPAALKKCPIAIVRGHGTFAVADSLYDALQSTSSLEHSARIIIHKNQSLNTLVKDKL